MARKIIKYAGWYVAYEVLSSALIFGMAGMGYRFAGL